MQRLQQMLMLARLESGQGAGRLELSELRELVRVVVGEAAPRAVAKGLDISLEDGPAVELDCHPALIAVLARNLVDNAVRYTPEGGTVTVRIERQNDRLTLSVSDSGPGIPPAQRSAVLQRFHRLDQGGQPGSGLGLAIVARIAELHAAQLYIGTSPMTKGLDIRVQFAAPCTAP